MTAHQPMTATVAGTGAEPGTGTEAAAPVPVPAAGSTPPAGAAVRPVEALLLVDLQTAFVAGDEAVPDAARVLDRSRDLLARARAAGALVVHLQNDGAPGTADEPYTPGWRLRLPVVPGPRETVVRKTEDDGFDGTPLGALLADAGVEALALCGLLSEMCVSATARTALARGFRVVLPHDAHATYDIPAAPGISESVPAAQSSRAAEWALGDEAEIVARAAEVAFTAAPPGA
ncbi:isochorismatase family protein [Streptomyces angustmyceticus]|uniref:isochorismatase family protein n=1 Tax=Streptomyces angustmyceticus TaxID=285578 RepID=UPI00381732DB